MNLTQNTRRAAGGGALAVVAALLAALLAGCAGGLTGPNIRAGVDLNNPDKDKTPWVEDKLPPPPAYDVGRLIDLNMPYGSSVKIGIDPKTIAINHASGVVRYVVVARGPAAVNAMYEGIRCSTGEFRVYARQVKGQPWAPAEDGWRNMSSQTGVLVRHPYQLAQGGMCDGTVITATAGEMERMLRSSDLQTWQYR